MFLLIARIIIWLAVLFGVYLLLGRFVPKKAMTLLGGLVLLALLVLAFLQPADDISEPVWQLVTFPLKPLGLTLVLLGAGVLQIKKGSITKPGATMIALALVLLLCSSIPYLAYEFAGLKEQEAGELDRYRQRLCNCPAPPPLGKEQVGALVILAHQTTALSGEDQRIHLVGHGDRLLYAAELYEQQKADGRSPWVLISSDTRPPSPPETAPQNSAIEVRGVLQRLGLWADNIALVPPTDNLHDAALRVKDTLKKLGLEKEKILLITSGLVMRRAQWTFEHEKIATLAAPADFIHLGDSKKRSLGPKDFLPSAQALALTTQTVDEYLGLAFYFLRGWISPVVV